MFTIFLGIPLNPMEFKYKELNQEFQWQMSSWDS